MNFDPNVPFLYSFFEASAGFQNYRALVDTATNLRSLGFLDHWMLKIVSAPAERVRSIFLRCTL